jgi:hypothetical protein
VWIITPNPHTFPDLKIPAHSSHSSHLHRNRRKGFEMRNTGPINFIFSLIRKPLLSRLTPLKGFTLESLSEHFHHLFSRPVASHHASVYSSIVLARRILSPNASAETHIPVRPYHRQGYIHPTSRCLSVGRSKKQDRILCIQILYIERGNKSILHLRAVAGIGQ